ncbi:MAG: retropepsin-like aspartic protease [bacterium]
MVYNYNKSFSHIPAPCVGGVTVSSPQTEGKVVIEGIIESGAEMTVIPKWAIERLELSPVSMVEVRTWDGRISKIPGYLINLSIGNLIIKNLEVVSFDQDIALLGRDVLNKFVITLDGKRGILEIKEDEK